MARSKYQQTKIFHLSNPPPPGSLKHADVQDLLEIAQSAAGRLYGDVPYLCEALQASLRDGVQKCDVAEVDATDILEQQMRTEWRLLDAFNKHRLGRAAHIYYKSGPMPKNAVDYDEADNVPNAFKFFPLTGEVRLRGFQMVTPHIYQVPGTVDHNQEFSARIVGTKAAAPTWITPSPTPSSTDLQPSGKNKSGRGQTNYDKLSDAPSAWLALPDGNLTLAEILCFVPQSIKSWDVIDRILHNGALTVTIAGMINYFRNMPQGHIENNSVYRMMKGTFDKRSKTEPEYEGWSVSKHQGIKKPDGFDPASVSVQGFRAPINYYKRETSAAAPCSTVETILFRDLMNGVKTTPTGYDALDLTRCVQYCVDHPDEDWRYPQDFMKLVSKLPHDLHRPNTRKGPAPVLLGHQDKAAVDRHTSEHKKRGAMRMFFRQRDAAGRLSAEFGSDEEDTMEIDRNEHFDGDVEEATPTRKRKTRAHSKVGSDSDESDAVFTIRTAKRKKLLPKSPSRGQKTNRSKWPPLSLRKDISVEKIDSDSDEDYYRDPRRKVKRVSASLRSSGRTKRVIGSYNIDAVLGGGEVDTPMKPRTIPLAALRLMGKMTNNTEARGMEDASDFEDED